MILKPYYDHAGIQIFHGDCREVLPTLAPVDLVLTDPPYGIALANHARGKERADRSFHVAGDDSTELGQWIADWCAERDLPALIFCNPLRPFVGKWRQSLVWDKGPALGGGGDVATSWKMCHELILAARLQELNGPRDSSVLRFWSNAQAMPDHPCQKPEPLLRYLVNRASNRDQLILDPFMGSGTTLRAAKDLGRRAIGIEIEERYCEIAANRLRQEVLFPAESA